MKEKILFSFEIQLGTKNTTKSIHSNLIWIRVNFSLVFLLLIAAGIDLTKRKSGMHFFEMQVETKKN